MTARADVMKIKKKALDRIAEHALSCMPRECCGILFAKAEDPGTVALVLAAENVEPNDPRKKYLIDYKAHLRAAELEAQTKVQVVGYYHSHPDGLAWPSTKDVECAYAGPAYLIASVKGLAIEYVAWKKDGEFIVLESVEVAQGQNQDDVRNIGYG